MQKQMKLVVNKEPQCVVREEWISLKVPSASCTCIYQFHILNIDRNVSINLV